MASRAKRKKRERDDKVLAVVADAHCKKVPLHKFMAFCIREYGVAVITDRAIADFRDGLKPVQRRILWLLNEYNAVNKNMAAAAIVGYTQGSYHPHGEASIFSSAVNLASSMRYPLITGQGNWGDSITGDSESAARYISGRLSPLGAYLFERAPIFPMVKNYDGKKLEPLVIETDVPLILMNGVSGIAVGIAVNIPPHNVTNVCKALIYLLKNENATPKQLANLLKHPDYLQGGVLVSNKQAVYDLYATGRGKLQYMCEYHYEDTGKNKNYKLLVVDSAAPNFSVSSFKEKIADFVSKGYLETWYEEVVNKKDVDPKAPHKRLRICIGFTNSAFIEKRVLPLLKTSVSYYFAFVENQKDGKALFKTGNIKDLMLAWIDAQRDQETRWLTHKKDKLAAELFRVNTRLAAIKHIDTIADALKTKDPDAYLMKKLKWTEEQVTYILGVQVRTLAKLNSAALLKQKKQLEAGIKDLNKKLKNIDNVIKDNLLDISKRFGDPMRTRLDSSLAESTSALPDAQLNKIVIAGKRSGELWLDSKGNRKRADFICTTYSDFIVVLESGQFQMLDGATSLHAAAPSIVSICEPNELIALFDDLGKFLLCEAPESGKIRKNPVWLMRSKGTVKKAVTLSRHDILVLHTPRKTFVVKGKQLASLIKNPKRAGNYVNNKKVTDMYVIARKDTKFIKRFDGTPRFGVSENNVFLLDNGLRRYCDLTTAKAFNIAAIRQVAYL